MRLNFGIGITAVQAKRTSGAPAGLFSSGNKGFFFDPSQTSSLFQNADGTIPVTAAGQPVGRISDLSGQGNHAVQATASARPTYQTDGVKHWLAFDGVNDHLVTPTITWASFHATVGAGLRKNIDTRGTVIDGEGAPRFTLEAPGPTDGDYAPFLWSTLSVNATVRHVAPAPATSVLVADFNMSTRVVQMAANGGPTLTATAGSGSGMFSDAAFSIGRRTGASQFLNGRLFGVVAINRLLSATESAQLTAYLNTLTGAF